MEAWKIIFAIFFINFESVTCLDNLLNHSNQNSLISLPLSDHSDLNIFVFKNLSIQLKEEFLSLLGNKMRFQVSILHIQNLTCFTDYENLFERFRFVNQTTIIFIFPSSLSEFTCLATQIGNQERAYNAKKFQYYIFWPEENQETLNSSFVNNISGYFDIHTHIYLFRNYQNGSKLVWKFKGLYSINGRNISQELHQFTSYELQFISIWTIKTDFYQKEILIAGQNYVAMESSIVEQNGVLVLTSGMHSDFFDYLMKTYNFRIKLKPGTGWVFLHENGSLGGMGFQVDSGEVDISIPPSELLEYRLNLLSFLHPTYVSKVWGVFATPPVNSFGNMYLQSMTTNSWIMIIGIFMTILGVLMLVNYISNRKFSTKASMLDLNVLWIIGIISQQGWYCPPSTTPLRIVFITGLFSGLLLFLAFCSALVSNFSLPFAAIGSFDDLIFKNFEVYRSVLTIKTASIVDGLESMGKVPRMSTKLRAVDPRQTLPLVLNKKSVVIGNDDDLFFVYGETNYSILYTTQFICDKISTVALNNAPLFSGMFVKKGSPLKKPFNIKLTKLRETGIQFKLLKYYKQRVTIACPLDNGIQGEPLEIHFVMSAFVMLLISYIVSGLIVSFEKIVSSYNNNNGIYLNNIDKLVAGTPLVW